MEYYVINEAGRKIIPSLQMEQKDDAARTLSFLDRAGSATIEQMATYLNMTDYQIKSTIQFLIVHRWVWKNITKTSQF